MDTITELLAHERDNIIACGKVLGALFYLPPATSTSAPVT